MGQARGHALDLRDVDLLENGDGLSDERRCETGVRYFDGRGDGPLVEGLQKLGETGQGVD